MRHLCAITLIVAIALATPAARADRPKGAAAFLTGASAFFVCFAIGGVLVATSHTDNAQDNAGWLTMEAGFAAAPLVSHAATGEWIRGLVVAAPPMAMLTGTAVLLGIHPSTIEQGELSDQRVIWSFFGVGLLSSIAGVVDAALADSRTRSPSPGVLGSVTSGVSVAVAPVFASDQIGLRIRGTL